MPEPRAVPESLSEEYYQINLDILGSFNKFRPPLNIFRFKESVARIEPYYRVGQRLSSEQVEELAGLVKAGFIFVSREDHPVYIKHISYQLDLVLVDKNLKASEIADIFVSALCMRLDDFMQQPVPAVYQRLREDVLVLTQYLWGDPHRIRGLIRRLQTEHTLAHHSFNTGIVGLHLFIRQNLDDFQSGQIKRKTLDNMALGLFLHDLGMSKIPAFVREKSQPLTMDERQKVQQHPKVGYEMLAKLDAKTPEIEACVFEHHERMDGSGYPRKISGSEISVTGRLCALADSFAAMVSKRPYAQAMSAAEAARQLSQDEKRYDARLTKQLAVIVVNEKL